MSLVRPTGLSTFHQLYSLSGSNENSALYSTDSPSIESYEKYFLMSPIEEVTHQQPSVSGISDSSHARSYMRNNGGYHFNSDRDYLEVQSADHLNFKESEMMSKLRELERTLLDDNDDDSRSMEFDGGEWFDQVQSETTHDSPKESISSDSNISSISSNKEVLVSEESPRTAKHLLFECANALAEGNIEEASNVISELRKMVSIQGDPSQRLAAYMLEGLAARMALSGKFLYKALKCKEPPSSDRLAAMQILLEVCPYFKFGYITANGAIIEAMGNEKRVHIIDFDVSQGTQYIALIQTLADMGVKKKLPHLRLTGVDDPESVQRPVGGLKHIGQRLEKLAEALRVPFEFHTVASKTSLVSQSMLDCRPSEALIVNFAFQLHHMTDESVSTLNERDQLLRMAKSLNPKLVTVVEQDMNTNTTPFVPRFIEAYNYYSVVFNSLDATLPRDGQDRLNVEKQCLAKDIVNIVACEGDERIERYEVAGKWRARMMMAGFNSSPFSANVVSTIEELMQKQYFSRYTMVEEMGELHFGFEDKSLIVASAWR